MDAGMYDKTVTVNGCPFKWNVNPVFVPKPGQVEPCLTFNYYFIYKDIPVSNIEAVTIVHDLLSIPSHKYLFLADIKDGYLAINVHPDNRHYLAFYILKIG